MLQDLIDYQTLTQETRRADAVLVLCCSYRSDSLIRKEMYLSPLTVSELKRIVEESEIVKSVSGPPGITSDDCSAD